MSLIPLIILLVIFALSIFVHELGHYLAARYVGIVPVEFALGFGPKIASFNLSGTNFSLRLIPLGGFVSFPEQSESKNPNGVLDDKKLYQRVIVLVGGVVMNIILAMFIFTIITFNSNTVNVAGIADVNFIGVAKQEKLMPVYISDVINDSLAAHAGIKAESVITKVNAKTFSNADEFKALLVESDNITLQLADLEFTKFTDVTISNPNKSQLGIAFNLPQYPVIIIEYPQGNILNGLVHTINMIIYQPIAIGALINQSIATKDIAPVSGGVSGIVGVGAAVSGLYERQYFLSLLSLVAFINISLFIVNMLPVPAMDGGQIVIAVYETIAKRKVKIETREKMNLVSFAVILILSIAITLKDIQQFAVLQGLFGSLRNILGR